MSLEMVPAAQYVRASTERQPYSIEAQADAISRYARKMNFIIVKTFSDEARSGLNLKGRPALRELLQEVMAGTKEYRAILVFDVSRWGRFQDTDEAAHYEYICKAAGVPVHYCAEEFSNQGGVSDLLMKTLKRFMAGEYSRSMSLRCRDGLKNIVERGFKYGAVPGYGLRRMLVSASGRPKQLLCPGEHKSITTDRVVFVPGPKKEVAIVRAIYRQFVEELKSVRSIAADLNNRGVPCTGGKKWSVAVVNRTLTHPKYTGALVFNQTERKLRGPEHGRPRSEWIVVPNAFKGLVDQETFAAAQARFATFIHRKTDAQLLEDLKRLLIQEGRLSLSLWRTAKQRRKYGLASPSTYFERFGSVRHAYHLLGFEHSGKVRQILDTKSRQQALVKELLDYFPNEVSKISTQLGSVRFEGRLKIKVQVCRSFDTKRGRRWYLGSAGIKAPLMLAAILDKQNDQIEGMYVVPDLPSGRFWATLDRFKRTGIRLETLSNFCLAVRSFPQFASIAPDSLSPT